MTLFVPMHSGTSSPRRLALAALLGVTCALAGPPAGVAAEGPSPAGHYAFEVPLAPVCLDGTFPLSIETADGPVAGDLQVTTDVAGKITGTLSIRGDEFAVAGVVKYRKKGHKVKFTARLGKKDKITFKGDLFRGVFNGTAKGNVLFANGKFDAALDVSESEQQVARISAELQPGKGARLAGLGEVWVCGDPIPLQVKANNGKRFSLKVKGGKFKWSARGPRFFDGVPLSWNSTGFGAKTTGETLIFDALDAPSAGTYLYNLIQYEAEVTIPTNQWDPQQRAPVVYSIDPALPAGMTLDPLTGEIGGTPAGFSPQTTYTVSASNAAGVETTQVTFSVRGNRAYSLVPQSLPLTDEQIRHFLSRTHMGIEAEDVAAIQQNGIEAFTDQMFTWQTGTAAETAAFSELVNNGDPAGFEGQFPSHTDIARWWLTLMTKTEQPFQEQLAFFWHDHFAVGSEVLGAGMRHWMVNYINLLRTEGKGNFRDLLLAISRDEAMLVYLDGQLNRRGAPNENYAREFWELFSLGRDKGYTESDIVEGAKAFTGYRRRYNNTTGQYYMEFDRNRHETGDKTVLGVTIPAQNDTDDYAAMVDITLANRPAAEFICEKLFAWFVYDNPPEAVINSLASTMRANDYEIEPVLRQIFASEAFYSPRARKYQVKSPIDYAIGFIRTTGLEVPISIVDVNVTDLGQRPSRPPVVDGWPSGVSWLSAHAMVERVNHADDILDYTSYQNNAGNNLANVLPPTNERTAETVVDTLVDLLDVQLTAAERQSAIDYLNTLNNDGVVTASPFDGTSQSHVDTRVRGLLWILAQHPTYHLR